MDSDNQKPLAAKRGRGREKGYVMPQEHRDKIANANILNRLIAGFKGDVELTQGQIQIGLKLIDKVLPNLQSTTLEGGEKPVALSVSWLNPTDR